MPIDKSAAPNLSDPVFSRRSTLGAGAGLAAAGLFLHTAGAHDATPGASPEASPAAANGIQPDGTWAFTDDCGITITLPQAPVRIVADINAAAAL
jgi:hypothetical protein